MPNPKSEPPNQKPKTKNNPKEGPLPFFTPVLPLALGDLKNIAGLLYSLAQVNSSMAPLDF
jgi:hypothetical protein